MKLSIKLSTFLLLTAAPAFAEELIVLDEIIVTAGYTDTGISETGASVSVLISKNFRIPSGIIQAFESVPGVHGYKWWIRNNHRYFMRGLRQIY